MSVKMIEKKLESYFAKSEGEELQALREITQEVILASLGRIGFFNQAAFQGGTCLRIMHGLNRFSEDLDFTLLEPNPDFTWQEYLERVVKDLITFGYQLEVTDRHDTDSSVRLAFLKDEALGKILNLHYAGKKSILGKIRIKLEIDINPPAGGQNEMKYVDFPYLSPITVQNLPTLFAGKIHALLCRTYLKGRDWYDFIWYTARKTTLNYQYLEEALSQSGPLKGLSLHIDKIWLLEALRQKIESIDCV